MPYIPPVEPLIPDAQKNKAPELILQGLQQGFAAIGQINAQRRQSELAVQEMALKDKLAGEEHDLQLQKNMNDFEIAKQHNVLYGDFLKNTASTKGTLDELRRMKLMEHVQNVKDAADAQTSIDKTVADFTARGNEMKVFDAERQTKDSIGFAADLQRLTDEYKNAPSYTGIPDRLASLQSIADQQKIYLPLGATYDPDNKEWTGNTTSSPVPIWQVVKGIQDPATHDTWKNILTASGHITSETKDVPMEGRTSSWKRPIDTVWDKFVKGAAPTKKVTTDKADAQAQGILDSAGKVDFSRSQNRVPEAIPKLTRPQAGKYGTGLDTGETLPLPDLPPDASATPASSATPTVDPTMTDTILQQAHAVYAVNPGARDEILKRLAAKGIDPALFDKFNVGKMAA